MKIRISHVAGVYLLITFTSFFLALALYQIDYLTNVLMSIGLDIRVFFPNIIEIKKFAPWLLILSGILAFSFILSFLRFTLAIRLGVPGLLVERVVIEDKIFQGELTGVSLKITNNSMFDFDKVIVTDLVPDAFDIIMGENYANVNLSAGRVIEISYILRAAARGVHLVGPVNLQIRDRLAFFMTEVELPEFDEVRVFPAYSDIRRIEITQKMMGGFLPGQHTMFKLKGAGYDFHQLRRYYYGDPIKLVDWKASARMGRLMIREYHGEKVLKIYILIDTSYTMGFGIRRFTKLDFATRAGAIVAYLAQKLQDFFGVMLFSSTVHNFLKAKRGRGHFLQVLSVLSEAEPDGVANLPTAIRHLIDHERRSGFIIIITDLESDINTFEEGIKMALAHKLHPAVITVMSPYFEIPEARSPYRKIFRDAVILEYLRRFKMIGNRLGKYGVRILPATPQNIISVVLDSYVKAKMKMIGAI